MVKEQEIQTLPAPDATVRKRIVTAARAYFFAHGFRSVTMDDLAGQLGMSKRTLYAHFASKAALLEAILDAKFVQLDNELEQVTAESAGDFRAAIQSLLAHAQRHTEEIQPPFLRDMQRDGQELFKSIEVRRRELIRRHFSKLLEGGRREGRIRKDIPTAVILEILLGAVQAVMNPPRLEELGITPAAGFTAIINVILQGALHPDQPRNGGGK